MTISLAIGTIMSCGAMSREDGMVGECKNSYLDTRSGLGHDVEVR